VNDLIVLCYHGISDSWPAETSVRPADFEQQLEGFAARGYRGATLSDALTVPAAEKTVVVTFDDAHRSVLEAASPVMARLGVPGTVFVPTDYATSQQPMAWDGYDGWLGTEHERELDCMSWDELRGLASAGWEIGSHTCSHPRLSRLADDEILAELAQSRAECERRMGVPCRSIAYPYGDYDDRVVRAARDTGYSFATTVPRGPRQPLPLQWPRVGVYHGESARRVRLRARTRRLGLLFPVREALALRCRRP
jgi:peptidoglycan/xylan/chitin deacetylase (PgdA/CDA1 family)